MGDTRSATRGLKAAVLLVAALAAVALAPRPAWALCLNPLGCDKTTRAECIKASGKAQTEAAAKAQIAECARLPVHTERQCSGLSREWADYLRANGGQEWNWPKLQSKRDCREHYPSTFSAASWVTTAYCQANRARIEAAAKEIDPASGRSKKLAAAAAKARMLDLVGDLSDQSVVEVMRQAYYPDRTAQELAVAVFIDAPPDAHDVARACSAKTP